MRANPSKVGQGNRDVSYSASPSQAQYPSQSAPPMPSYQPPTDKPPIPQGWRPYFDQQSQHWYYVEEATGRSQWEAPGYQEPGAAGENRGHGGYVDPAAGGGGGGGHGGYGASSGGYGGHDTSYGHDSHASAGHGYASGQEKHKSNKGGVLVGAAGGLAAGAVGGVLIHEALSDSDSDHGQRYAAPIPAASYGSDRGGSDYGGDDNQAPPAVLPATDADGDSVSGSDRESVQEARDDYEEALADAQDSDAGSSEQEELEEAQEEYEEEYEETYDD